jgi:4-amino-4-deoxy-L-arabinose transferase-like glycosyltransferase
MTSLAERGPPAAARSRPRAWLAHPRAPLVLLGLLCLLAIGVRAYNLGTPVAKPPTQGYIFDERYYASAAGVIAGEPVRKGNIYYGAAPSGADPNGEHPQLGKLIIAASIRVFGDSAVGWRITAVVFGVAAILLLYWLVRCAGGGSWLALGAAALGTFDNLWVVHARIAVLDIYTVPFMLAGVGLYLRRRPLLAGLVIGVGSCVKEFTAYMLLVLLLIELMRGAAVIWRRRTTPSAAPTAAAAPTAPPAPATAAIGAPGAATSSTPPLGPAPVTPPVPTPPRRRAIADRAPLRALAVCVVAVFTYFSLLSVLDTTTTPYSGGHPVDRNEAGICKYALLWQDGCNHFAFMNRFAARLRDSGSPHGIAAAPTEFWLNRKVITYYATSRTVSVNGVVRSTQKLLWFRGEISRVLLLTSWLALALNVWWAVRRRDELSFLVVAWALGTWLPAELFHAIDQRTTYIYYMVVTMPALYIAVARLLGLAWLPNAGRLLSVRRLPVLLIVLWAALLLLDFANLYPFRTLSGS